MISLVKAVALIGQVVCLVVSLGMPLPAKGALLLASLWFFGVNVGVSIYTGKHGGDRVAD